MFKARLGNSYHRQNEMGTVAQPCEILVLETFQFLHSQQQRLGKAMLEFPMVDPLSRREGSLYPNPHTQELSSSKLCFQGPHSTAVCTWAGLGTLRWRFLDIYSWVSICSLALLLTSLRKAGWRVEPPGNSSHPRHQQKDGWERAVQRTVIQRNAGMLPETSTPGYPSYLGIRCNSTCFCLLFCWIRVSSSPGWTPTPKFGDYE